MIWFGPFSQHPSPSYHLKDTHCVKNVQIWSFFWSLFSCICTESEDLGVNLRIHSEYRKTRTRKNSVFGHFSRSVQPETTVSSSQTTRTDRLLTKQNKKPVINQMHTSYSSPLIQIRRYSEIHWPHHHNKSSVKTDLTQPVGLINLKFVAMCFYNSWKFIMLIIGTRLVST